jgi:hypothetical protein
LIRELRIYDCAPGRRPALVRRFEDHTLAIFARHGFRPGTFLLSTEDEDRLVYFLDWEDMAERDAGFSRFRADPDWIAARAASERDGPVTLKVTSAFFTPLEFPQL